MYQIKSVGGVAIRNGYEIVVDGPRCEVRNRAGEAVFHGKCEQCEQWLRDRTLCD